uniref:Uncharacterized protein n=1 Tax=Siphoviridae sp. ctKNZ79 TaxID=2825440 RepID=A0A8S5U9I1_9CAUD|nr:MAG TPA: hypothetical protein [Siphoviridae sp. ctKNZ79]
MHSNSSHNAYCVCIIIFLFLFVNKLVRNSL